MNGCGGAVPVSVVAPVSEDVELPRALIIEDSRLDIEANAEPPRESVAFLILVSCQLNILCVKERSTNAWAETVPSPYKRLAKRITVGTEESCMMTLERGENPGEI